MTASFSEWGWPREFYQTHPDLTDLLRFADDGGQVPENDRTAPIRIGSQLRIRMPEPHWDKPFGKCSACGALLNEHLMAVRRE